MLAQNFKTASDLGLTEKQFSALVATLGMLERGELPHVQRYRCLSTENRGIRAPTHFNMNSWMAETDCGTVCCIGGTAELVGGLARDELFDLTLSDPRFRDLCFGRGRGDFEYKKITPSQAASALRNYLTHGEPRWAEVLS